MNLIHEFMYGIVGVRGVYLFRIHDRIPRLVPLFFHDSGIGIYGYDYVYVRGPVRSLVQNVRQFLYQSVGSVDVRVCVFVCLLTFRKIVFLFFPRPHDGMRISESLQPIS